MSGFFKRRPTPKNVVDAGPADPAPAAKRRDLKPEPERIGITGSVPFARLPDPSTLFLKRAERLRQLAPDHPLGGYLAFLAQIAEAQAAVQAERPTVPAAAQPDETLRTEHGMPPLSRHGLDGRRHPHQRLERAFPDFLEPADPGERRVGHFVGGLAEDARQLVGDLLAGQPLEVDLADIDDEAG